MSRTSTILILSLGTLVLASCSQKETDLEEAALGSDGPALSDPTPGADLPIAELDGEGGAEAQSIAALAPGKSSEAKDADPRPAAAAMDLADDFDVDEPEDFGGADYSSLAVVQTSRIQAEESVRSRDMSASVSSASASARGLVAGVGGGTRGAPRRERRADQAAAYGGQALPSTPAQPAVAAPSGGEVLYYAPPPAEPIPEPDVATVPVGNSESYVDHGVNPFTIVTQDALSTFSIDVDTASYTIARRKLNEGGLPPSAAVRVEEFVNFFDYGYREPSQGPFAVHMEAMPDPFRAGHHTLRVGVQGAEVSREERPPLHLTFLADVSGSMSSADKLPLAKEALHMLVDSLREDDTVGLCTYAGRVARILEPTSAANKREIHDAIEALNSGGSTAMSAGIDIAYEMAWEAFEEGHENRVIVMSDGDANVGNTSWEQMLANIKGYADQGVTVSTIGFGMGNYKDTLMEQLSNNGDGNNFYIDGREQAQRVFVEDLAGTLVTIARDVKIQVDFNPDSVFSYRLIGYENRDIADKDFRNDRVDAGEVGAGTNVTALYDVILKDGYTRELATVRLRWEAPGADKAAVERAYAFSHSALKEASYLTSRSTRVAYAAGTFAEILRSSPHAAEISLAALAKFAQTAARPGEDDDAELVELIRKADALGAQNVAVR